MVTMYYKGGYCVNKIYKVRGAWFRTFWALFKVVAGSKFGYTIVSISDVTAPSRSRFSRADNASGTWMASAEFICVFLKTFIKRIILVYP